MPKHQEKRTLPFSPAQLFDLVADVEGYPEFLPWCKGARILERLPLAQSTGDNKSKSALDVSEWQMKADLIIGYKMFQEKFTSLVTLDRPHKISVKYLSGPLAHLTNEWEFFPNGSGCDLVFHVEFDFRSHMLSAIMEPFFDKAMRKMAEAFEERAKELYGTNARSQHDER